MATFHETFDLTNGTTFDTGNTAYDNVVGTAAADTGTVKVGTASLSKTIAGTLRLADFFPASTPTHYRRIYLRTNATPTANTVIYEGRNVADTGFTYDVRITTGGNVQLRNSSLAQVAITSNVISIGAWNRIEIAHANGLLTVRLYKSAQVDAVASSFTEQVSGNFAVTDVGRVAWGLLNGDTAWAFRLDDDRGNDTAWVGPENPAPSTDIPAGWDEVRLFTPFDPATATWGEAWAASDQSVLLSWFKANTGPTVALTTTTTGTYTVASQADADALVGRTVTGRIVVTANCTMRDFRLVNDGSAGTALDIAGGLTVTVEDFELDGAGHDTTVAGVGGGSWATVTMRRAHIHHCLDAVRLCEGSTYENLFVHDPIYVPSYAGSSTQHADAVQAVRGATPIVVTKSWLDHGADPSGDNITSAAIIKSDSAAIDDVTIDYTYLNGGGYTITIEAGANGAPTNIKVRNNRIGRNYRNGVWSGAGVNDGADYDRTGNVWADDFTPATTTWGFLGAGQTYVDPGY